jgi:predicted nucleic acid-binding protein
MIAYDTNILIYAFEGTNSWSKAAQLIVLQGEHDGAVLSILAWQELMTGAVLRGDNSDEKLATVLRNLSATRFVPVTLAICKRATDLTKRFGKQLYGYDAIHIATAIEHKAEFFVTNDRMLTNLQLDELIVRGL